MSITIDISRIVSTFCCSIILLVSIGSSSALSQTNVFHHSFNSGVAYSSSGNVMNISLLGQTIFGSSAASGILLRSGNASYSNTITSTVKGENEFIPKKFLLYQNYPNPFNPSTVINYQIPVNSHVTLKVYDAIGREVATLVNEVNEAGYYSVQFDAARLSSGMYVVRLQSGEKIQVKKMMMMK